MLPICDECGTTVIDDCLVCGAPVCCPRCCKETQDEEQKSHAADRPDQTKEVLPPYGHAKPETITDDALRIQWLCASSDDEINEYLRVCDFADFVKICHAVWGMIDKCKLAHDKLGASVDRMEASQGDANEPHRSN